MCQRPNLFVLAKATAPHVNCEESAARAHVFRPHSLTDKCWPTLPFTHFFILFRFVTPHPSPAFFSPIYTAPMRRTVAPP
jgi:hypothetical protein